MESLALQSLKIDIDRCAQTLLPVEFQGQELQLEAFAYQGADPAYQALALVHRSGAHAREDVPIVRVHSGCVTGDIFHSLRCDCYAQLQASLARVVGAPKGAIIYLPYHEGRGIGLVNKIRAYALQDRGFDTVDANIELGAPIDAREYDLAAQILRDLDMSEIRLMTNNPGKVEALRAHGITVLEQVPIVVEPSSHNKRYLETKRRRMAHKL